MNPSPLPPSLDFRMRRLVWFAAGAFGIAFFCDSAACWAHFGYRTFDLAFYVQALWKLSHGDFGPVSLLNVPLLGEHASVIVFLMTPLFAIAPHPLLPVALQIIAISSMAPVGYRIARRLGLEPEPAGLLALATLLAPAAGFVALHEFHPEAFTAPFLLLAIDAFQRQSVGRFWLWFLATLACKENMTLLLAAWCGVNAFSAWREERRHGRLLSRNWLGIWCLLPCCVALGWAALYAGVLSPRWNGGNVDFTALYSHLSVPWRGLPQAIFSHLCKSIGGGNLLPALLIPLLCLPLLRSRWLFVASPILFQHFLSLRPSEWQVNFHYAAPLIPLFWVAACEAVASISTNAPRILPLSTSGCSRLLAVMVFGACLTSQLWVGPLPQFTRAALEGDATDQETLVASVPPAASVVAGLPFLSHLAERQDLISLHLLLKGLKTLSRKAWVPPPATDVVLVDYSDTATFDSSAGYYHPGMRVEGGLIVPSSDRLLHLFLRQAAWDVQAHDSLTVFRKRQPGVALDVGLTEGSLFGGVMEMGRSKPATRFAEVAMLSSGPGIPGGEPSDATPPPEARNIPEPPALQIDSATSLVGIAVAAHPLGLLSVESRWRFSGERKLVPWMVLRITSLDQRRNIPAIWISRGLCAPEGWDNGTIWRDRWTATLCEDVGPGTYRIDAVFFDNANFSWTRLTHPNATIHPVATVTLGTMRTR